MRRKKCETIIILVVLNATLAHINYVRYICMNFVALCVRLRLNIECAYRHFLLLFKFMLVPNLISHISWIFRSCFNDVSTLVEESKQVYPTHFNLTPVVWCVRRKWEKFSLYSVGFLCMMVESYYPMSIALKSYQIHADEWARNLPHNA